MLIIISPTGYDDLNVSIADQHLAHPLHGVCIVNMLRVDEQKSPGTHPRLSRATKLERYQG